MLQLRPGTAKNKNKPKKQFLCGPRPLNFTPSNTTVLAEEEGPRMQVLSGIPAWDSFQLEERVIKKAVVYIHNGVLLSH